MKWQGNGWTGGRRAVITAIRGGCSVSPGQGLWLPRCRPRSAAQPWACRNPSIIYHFKFFSVTPGHLPPATCHGTMGSLSLWCIQRPDLSYSQCHGEDRNPPEGANAPKASDEKRRRMLDEKRKKTFSLQAFDTATNVHAKLITQALRYQCAGSQGRSTVPERPQLSTWWGARTQHPNPLLWPWVSQQGTFVLLRYKEIIKRKEILPRTLHSDCLQHHGPVSGTGSTEQQPKRK